MVKAKGIRMVRVNECFCLETGFVEIITVRNGKILILSNYLFVWLGVC